MAPSDDDHDEKPRRLPLGDIGTILLAGVFLAGTVAIIIFLFSSPEPIRDMFAKRPSAAAEPNEVTIMLPQKK